MKKILLGAALAATMMSANAETWTCTQVGSPLEGQYTADFVIEGKDGYDRNNDRNHIDGKFVGDGFISMLTVNKDKMEIKKGYLWSDGSVDLYLFRCKLK